MISVCSLNRIIFGLVLLFSASAQHAVQGQEPRNVVLITLDGLRAEEVFSGADQRLMTEDNGVKDPGPLNEAFVRESREERRKALMPFLWEQCQADGGWIAGDLDSESVVAVTNGRYFSYPGYNELLCGMPDPRVDSNNKKYNDNVTVLEWLHAQPPFAGKVAAYCSWDVFPYIINDRRSGIPVNAGWQALQRGDPERIGMLNLVADHLFRQWESVRYDVFTARGAVEEIKLNQPRVLYVALGETDDWAHEGRYDRYLTAAHHNDRLIRMLWEATQEFPSYRGTTLFLLTSDHGRGDGRQQWRSHGENLPGSERTWVAAFGSHLQTTGIDAEGRYRLAQVAATVAAYLGEDFTTMHEGIHRPLPIVAMPTAPASEK